MDKWKLCPQQIRVTSQDYTLARLYYPHLLSKNYMPWNYTQRNSPSPFTWASTSPKWRNVALCSATLHRRLSSLYCPPWPLAVYSASLFASYSALKSGAHSLPTNPFSSLLSVVYYPGLHTPTLSLKKGKKNLGDKREIQLYQWLVSYYKPSVLEFETQIQHICSDRSERTKTAPFSHMECPTGASGSPPNLGDAMWRVTEKAPIHCLLIVARVIVCLWLPALQPFI